MHSPFEFGVRPLVSQLIRYVLLIFACFKEEEKQVNKTTLIK
jgi:hypothetical protein